LKKQHGGLDDSVCNTARQRNTVMAGRPITVLDTLVSVLLPLLLLLLLLLQQWRKDWLFIALKTDELRSNEVDGPRINRHRSHRGLHTHIHRHT